MIFSKRVRARVWGRLRYEWRPKAWGIKGKFGKTRTVRSKQGVFEIFSGDYGIGKPLYCYREFELDLMQIAAGFWSSYWVLRGEELVEYPISVLYTLFDELGSDGEYINVIFTR